MTGLDIKDIINWSQAELLTGRAGQSRIRQVSSDSRTIRPGDLFIALHGERFDGHAFLSQAIQGQAAALLIEQKKSWTELADLPQTVAALKNGLQVLYVADTLKALQDIARGYRQTLPGQVIAITGSVGKTSTRRMVVSCLKTELLVHEAAGNFNNEIGLPQSILAASAADQALVLEMGMRAAGEISQLGQIARPDIAIITSIGWSHIGRLGSKDAILAAKWEVVSAIRPGGLLILNGDDEKLLEAAATVPSDCRLALVFTSQESARAAGQLPRRPEFVLTASQIKLAKARTDFTISRQYARAAEELTVSLPLAGRHHVRNSLFGLAVATALGLDLAKAAAAVAAYQPVGNRQRLIEIGGITVMDDSYNASPESMEAALETSVLLAGPGRYKAAALASMLELGPFAPQIHRQIGKYVAELGFDLLLTFGKEADDYLIGARSVRPEIISCSCSSHQEMAQRLVASLSPGDFLLVKGSRAYAMEEVTELLGRLLPQQGS